MCTVTKYFVPLLYFNVFCQLAGNRGSAGPRAGGILYYIADLLLHAKMPGVRGAH